MLAHLARDKSACISRPTVVLTMCSALLFQLAKLSSVFAEVNLTVTDAPCSPPLSMGRNTDRLSAQLRAHQWWQRTVITTSLAYIWLGLKKRNENKRKTEGVYGREMRQLFWRVQPPPYRPSLHSSLPDAFLLRTVGGLLVGEFGNTGMVLYSAASCPPVLHMVGSSRACTPRLPQSWW
jgi:hypothetical protein